MRLKLDRNGNVVTAAGHPVYVHADGSEKPFDAAASIARAEKAEAGIIAEQIGFAVSHSKFVTEKLTIPPDMAAAAFRSSFKIEAGKFIGYGADGVKIWSRQWPGEVAGIDEALEVIVAAHPDKARILKALDLPGKPDTGARPIIGDGQTLTRSAFEKLPPDARMAHVKAGGALVS
jgi:hypothetical protein